MATMTIAQFQSRAQLARERAGRIRSYRDAAMRQALTESGIGAWTGLNVLHNALLAREEGKPWQEVNYSAARRAARLESQLFEADAIATAYIDRIYKAVL